MAKMGYEDMCEMAVDAKLMTAQEAKVLSKSQLAAELIDHDLDRNLDHIEDDSAAETTGM